jgi:hypothetical protein
MASAAWCHLDTRQEPPRRQADLAIDSRQGVLFAFYAWWLPLPPVRVNPFWRGSMAVQKIDKSDWRAFFDWLSQGLLGARAEIEVASLDLGDQIEAESLPLLGITYDDKDDLLEVALDGLDHLIYSPREVWADFNVGEMMSFEVIDDRGVSQIIKLRQPLMLPSPSPLTARD